jgi:tRNA 2-thiouridine synthesizing protein A
LFILPLLSIVCSNSSHFTATKKRAAMTAPEFPPPARRLDARGLLCPLPVLRARKLLKELAEGEILEVEATDRSAPADFAAFCAATGWRLAAAAWQDGVYRVAIEKTGPGGAPAPRPADDRTTDSP